MQTSTKIYDEAIFISCCSFCIYLKRIYLAAPSEDCFWNIDTFNNYNLNDNKELNGIKATKKSFGNSDNFLTKIAHTSSKRTSEKVFFKENKNKLVSISVSKKSLKTERFKNMYFQERVTQELRTLYICKV